jgi:flagellar biosynthesis protein FlhG
MESLAGQYDLILLDHSSGVSWGVLQFAAASHQHVVVTTSEPTSYTDAYAIMKLLSKRFAIREFQLLVTMCQNRPETERVIGRFMDVARSHLDIRVTLLDVFPWEPKLSESIRRRQPFALLHPSSDFTLRLEKICQQLEESSLRPSHGLSFFYESAR